MTRRLCACGCGRDLPVTARSHAKTATATCRKRLSRQVKAAENAHIACAHAVTGEVRPVPLNPYEH